MSKKEKKKKVKIKEYARKKKPAIMWQRTWWSLPFFLWAFVNCERCISQHGSLWSPHCFHVTLIPLRFFDLLIVFQFGRSVHVGIAWLACICFSVSLCFSIYLSLSLLICLSVSICLSLSLCLVFRPAFSLVSFSTRFPVCVCLLLYTCLPVCMLISRLPLLTFYFDFYFFFVC